MAFNITPNRRWVLEAIGRGEVVRTYHYEEYHPYDDGWARWRGKYRRGSPPIRFEYVIRTLLLADLVVLPKDRQPTDTGGSMRRYQLTDAGRDAIEAQEGR